jgi:hypothetical protein
VPEVQPDVVNGSGEAHEYEAELAEWIGVGCIAVEKIELYGCEQEEAKRAPNGPFLLDDIGFHQFGVHIEIIPLELIKVRVQSPQKRTYTEHSIVPLVGKGFAFRTCLWALLVAVL